jgi:microcystin degradation protein MlrC
MRIPVLGISHETNTFSTVPADYAAFEASGILRGAEIIDKFVDAQYTISGYHQAAEELGFELVPLMYAVTGPIGTITKDAYDRLTEEMFQMLRDGGPWDAVLISNHGAAVSEEFPDMDGEFCRAVREIVGPDMRIGITLDMHGNVSKPIVEHTDVCLVWRTNPHLDPKVRGRKTAELVVQAAKGEIDPVQWIEMPPMYVNIVKQFTGEEPMKSFVEDCVAANAIPGILDTSVAEGYPYSDVEEMGMSWVAIADGDLELAKSVAKDMAAKAWERRDELNVQVPSITEALDFATANYVGPRDLNEADGVATDGTALAPPEDDEVRNGPIVLMDVGDNIGGGSSADSTHILAEAVERGISGFLQTLYDPASVDACVVAGIGATVTLDVGGKTDAMHGNPVRVTGIVRAITDGKYEELGASHGGFRFYDSGISVRLDTDGGQTLLLTSARAGNTVRAQMYHIGIIPERHRIVVAKGVVSPRPAYQPIAGKVILVNTPGVTTADMSTFTYHHRRVPLYPMELDAKYGEG